MLIELVDIHREYEVGGETVLAGVSTGIAKGEWVAIIGRVRLGQVHPDERHRLPRHPERGRYHLNGRDVAGLTDDELAAIRNREIGFISRTSSSCPERRHSPMSKPPLVYRGLPAKERHRRAVEALERVRLANRMTHKPTGASGGQRQRVAIARALAAEPSLLLADEPTGNLDSTTGEEIIRLFSELHQQGHTIVLVTHEPKLAARCPRAIRLSDGKVVGDGPGNRVAWGSHEPPVVA